MDRLERLAIAQSFALSSVFLSMKESHGTLQNHLHDVKNTETCVTEHNHVTLHSTAKPLPYVCFSPSTEGESVQKHGLLLPKQISKSTQSSEMKLHLLDVIWKTAS